MKPSGCYSPINYWKNKVKITTAIIFIGIKFFCYKATIFISYFFSNLTR